MKPKQLHLITKNSGLFKTSYLNDNNPYCRSPMSSVLSTKNKKQKMIHIKDESVSIDNHSSSRSINGTGISCHLN